MKRLTAIAWHALLVAVALSPTAPMAADGYPDRAVRLLVGFAPGGGTDTLARIVAKTLAEKLGQPVIVENRPGADGAIATAAVASATPDGYTIAWITNSHTITPSTQTLAYDPIKDFAPVTQIAYTPSVIAASARVPAKSLKEVIEYARARPGKLNFASSGTGTIGFLELSLLNKLTGIDIVNVSYKGAAPSMVALLAGEVDLSTVSVSVALSNKSSDKIRLLAVTTQTRSPALPDIPTVAEAAGLPSFDTNLWFGMLAPARTPPEVVRRLREATVASLQAPEVQKVMQEQGFIPVGSTPEAMATLIASDIARWSDLLKTAKKN